MNASTWLEKNTMHWSTESNMKREKLPRYLSSVSTLRFDFLRSSLSLRSCSSAQTRGTKKETHQLMHQTDTHKVHILSLSPAFPLPFFPFAAPFFFFVDIVLKIVLVVRFCFDYSSFFFLFLENNTSPNQIHNDTLHPGHTHHQHRPINTGCDPL